jgi:biopolymer transport protein ExbB/TolQ
MLDLFYQGGPLFMGLLTIILIIMIAVTVINGSNVLKGTTENPDVNRRKIGTIKSVGLFALIIGILGQLLGLFSAFKAIELKAVEVSPSLIAGGFKVSMITTIYGLIIFALSILIWFGLNSRLERK